MMKIRYKSLWVLLIAGILSLVTSNLMAKKAMPAATQPNIAVWVAFWDWRDACTTLDTQSKTIKEVMPFWYDMDSTGEIFYSEGIPHLISAGRLDLDTRQFTRECQAKGMKVLPLISNEFDKQRVHNLLSDPASRQRHIDNILQLIRLNGYDGVDIDYEGLKKEDREAYALFLMELGKALHQEKKLLSVAIAAKTSEPGNWDSVIALDYKAIGKAADRVRIMAYDYHYSGGEPGPIAPLSWVRNILEFSTKEIPPQKIWLGIGAYGIDWGPGKDRELTYTGATALAAKYQAVPQWDPDWSETWFTYTEESTLSQRTVWFQESQSFQKRWEFCKKFKIGGVSIWRIGGEDPEIWEFLRKQEFRQAKSRRITVPAKTKTSRK
jgi:spore germination protein YaaH